LTLNIQKKCSDTTVVLVTESALMTVGEIHYGGNTATVNIWDSARIHISSHGKVMLEDYSKLNIQKGGVLRILNGGILQAEQNAKITIEDGGILDIREGGKHFLQDLAKLEVKAGGRLIIHENAKIEMDDPIFIDGRATIHIRGNGILQIKGVYEFLGNGYLQFDKDNILQLDGDAFALKGKEKGIQFIRLNTDAQLLLGDKDLVLSRGKVVYAHGTAIKSDEMADISVDSTVFVGMYAQQSLKSEARALYIIRPQYFNVRVCEFDYLTYGITLTN
jgi:co-chaperonin GroES (HSP10)